MTTKRQISRWLKQIDKRMKGVAAECDKLDELISSIEDLKEVCERAHGALQEARDALSELV